MTAGRLLNSPAWTVLAEFSGSHCGFIVSCPRIIDTRMRAAPDLLPSFRLSGRHIMESDGENRRFASFLDLGDLTRMMLP